MSASNNEALKAEVEELRQNADCTIYQQDILKAYLNATGMTRADFCEKYKDEGVQSRALDSWLLPSTSQGYRKMPELLQMNIANELMIVLADNAGSHVELNYEPTDSMVSFENNNQRIYFPKLFLIDGYHEVTPELEAELTEYQRQFVVNGKSIQQDISFSDKLGKNGHIVRESCEELKRAPKFNQKVWGDQNFWFYVIRVDTGKEATALLHTLYCINDDESLVEYYSTVKYNGNYFVLFVKKAPEWHNKPLIIYSSRMLKKTFWGELIVDTWEKVLDENGDTVDMPDVPFEDE